MSEDLKDRMGQRGVKREPSDWGPWKCFPSIAAAMMAVRWSTRALRGHMWGPFTRFDECVIVDMTPLV
ncbi:hypothetical protein ACLB2K_024071 [Fragaria x ananassa]